MESGSCMCKEELSFSTIMLVPDMALEIMKGR